MNAFGFFNCFDCYFISLVNNQLILFLIPIDLCRIDKFYQHLVVDILFRYNNTLLLPDPELSIIKIL